MKSLARFCIYTAAVIIGAVLFVVLDLVQTVTGINIERELHQ